MHASDFDFELPPELIAQEPLPQRDQSRLLVCDRVRKEFTHARFTDLPNSLQPGDLLVLNDSKVIPARLRALKDPSGGEFELLLLEEKQRNDWWCLVKPAKRAQPGTRLRLQRPSRELVPIYAHVTDANEAGHRRLRFSGTANILDELATLGEIPLPPYIKRSSGGSSPSDAVRYQTVYAQAPGSVAAPTAGLHFTPELLQQLQRQGIGLQYLTLHVGLGTFAPVKAEDLTVHVMHEEWYDVRPETAAAVNAAKKEGRRVVAVGTTTCRVLESIAAANKSSHLSAGSGRTRLFVRPPFHFRIVDALVTNFHLPRSTLLMLVSAFASPGDEGGRELVLRGYAEAIQQRYRFFSYGDAMLIA